MYEIHGRIYEKHGDYQAYLEVWTAETSVKTMLFNAFEERVSPAGDLGDEHLEIVEVIRTLMRRIAEKHDRALL